MTIPNQRDAFDLPDDLTFLNCAAQSPALKVSFAAGERGLRRKLHPWSEERGNLSSEMAEARRLFGAMIGAEAHCIALMTSTSYGTAIAAANLRVRPGQKIVVLQDQFPSNYYCWQHLAARDNGHMVVVARPEDGDWTAAVLDAIDGDIGLVALPNCHWTDGGRLDLEAIAKCVHDVGAAFVIDATQSIGAQPFDVGKLDPDFVACSAYKWLLSPDAVGFLYVAPRHLGGRPIEDNHAGRISESSMELSAGYGRNYLPDASRFDQGAADSMIHMPMAVTALQQLLDWRIPDIAESLRPLTDYAAELAEARGWRVPPRDHRVAHFIGLYAGDLPGDLDAQLRARNIFISLRGGAIRISPHLFNTKADIDRLFATLDDIL